MKKMPEDLRLKLKDLMLDSKMGIRTLSPEECDLFGKMHREYPEDYSTLHAEVTKEATAAMNPLYDISKE